MKEFLKHLLGIKDPTPEEQLKLVIDIMRKTSPEMKQKEKEKEEEEEEEKDSEDENSEEK